VPLAEPDAVESSSQFVAMLAPLLIASVQLMIAA